MWIGKVSRAAFSFAAVSLVCALVACGGGSSSNSVTQNPAPSITQEPVGPSIKSGQTAMLSVTATGSGTLSYQWYQGPSGTTTNPVSGATSSSYTTPALTATTSYWVQVSDSAGSTNSNTAVVLIAGPRQVQALMYMSATANGLTVKIPGDFLTNVLPHLSGVALSLQWSSVDTTSENGTGGYTYSYDFSSFDALLQQFYQTGRSVNLIVWPATEGGSNTPGNGGSTPAYVFSSGYAAFVGASNPQDMSVCQDYQGDSASPYALTGSGGIWNSSDPTYGSDLSGLPVSYELPFQTAYQQFIAAVIQHYNQNLQTLRIGYIRFGFSQGGENSPECNQYWPNFTQTNSQGQTTYLSYVQAMTEFVKSQNPSMTILEDLHSLGQLSSVGASTYVIYPDAEAQYATAEQFGFGTNGLQKSDITNFQSTPPQPCDSDWCNLFVPAGGFSYSPTLSLQTLQWTDPTDSDPSNPTGSLTDIEPFAKSHGANNLELYQADVGLAFDSANYDSYPHAVSSLNTGSYSSSYASAIEDFLTP